MSTNLPDLADRILIEEEKSEPCVYKDSKGYWTIGVGACVDPAVKGVGLCQAAIDAQLDYNKQQAVSDANSIPGFSDCNDVQQASIISMCFQMGALEWPDFRAAIAAKNYPAAAAAALDSNWARNETPIRAQREAYMIGSGKWLDYGAPIPANEETPNA
jgi:GH24 family phage-related lysozyme (muramidase)